MTARTYVTPEGTHIGPVHAGLTGYVPRRPDGGYLTRCNIVQMPVIEEPRAYLYEHVDLNALRALNLAYCVTCWPPYDLRDLFGVEPDDGYRDEVAVVKVEFPRLGDGT